MDVPLNPIALGWAFFVYRGRVLPLAQAELRRWQLAAEQIPDPALREAALVALADKSANVEATAVFAILAPRSRRAAALRAIAALQIAVDYLDTLGEQRVDDPLADGLALHAALHEAVSPGASPSDWYSLHPQKRDGGYLAALVNACQGEVERLPAANTVVPTLREAARRCGEGQSHTHATTGGRATALESWAVRQATPPGYRWWEIAAGASSSVAAHALIAAAADPVITAAEAKAIDSAYFPSIGALTVLLDDLVDHEDDLRSGEHSYLAYYESGEAAALRLGSIAQEAQATISSLRRRRRHAAILAGVAGFYLSALPPDGEYATPIRTRLIQSLGWTVRLIQLAVRSTDRG